MTIRRIHRTTERTPEQLAELRATRAAFQAEKPSLDDLIASGDYEEPRSLESVVATAPKYPAVRIKLSGLDGNAFVILGRCRAAAMKGGVPDDEIKAFVAEAMDGDYGHLLRICMKWFNVR